MLGYQEGNIWLRFVIVFFNFSTAKLQDIFELCKCFWNKKILSLATKKVAPTNQLLTKNFSCTNKKSSSVR
jgi:hypothetical protein